MMEQEIEQALIQKLGALQYIYRPDITGRAILEQNFCEKFEALNRVTLMPGEFSRLLEEIISPDVFTAARTLCERNSFTRDDGTPLNYTLVINQLRINTVNSPPDTMCSSVINGVPVVQIELKTLGTNRSAIPTQI